MRGDLDWIVMKALEKNRARRYETVNGLALDIRRHLNGEAVEAAAPTIAYRFGKFVRRHLVGVTATCLVMASLVAGIVSTAWQAGEARRQQQRAEESRVTRCDGGTWQRESHFCELLTDLPQSIRLLNGLAKMKISERRDEFGQSWIASAVPNFGTCSGRIAAARPWWECRATGGGVAGDIP